MKKQFKAVSIASVGEVLVRLEPVQVRPTDTKKPIDRIQYTFSVKGQRFGGTRNTVKDAISACYVQAAEKLDF